MSDKKENPKDFEDALKRLETIVEALEDGDLSLEQSLERYEQGVGLSKYCHNKLEEAEKRIAVLRVDDRGEPLLDSNGEPQQRELEIPEDSEVS